MPEGGERLTQAEALQAQVGALYARLWRLSEAGLGINESLEFDSVLQVVVDSAREMTGARFGGIIVIDGSGHFERFVSSGMTPEEHRLLTELPGGPRFFEHLVRLGEPLRVPDVGAYFRSHGLPKFRPRFEIGSCLAAPICSNREAVGFIYLAKGARGPEFSDEDGVTLAAFISQAAPVIANARRYRDERRARADLETLIDTSPVGMLVFDAPRGTAVRTNREALRIVSELLGPGESVADLLKLMTVRRADGREVSLAEIPLAQALGTGETVRAEQIVLARPGRRSRTVLINATPVRSDDGNVESVVVTMQDMTPLEEIDRLRADFLGLVSEELRPSLVAVKGSAATLLESLPALDPAETTQLVRVIDAQANRMRDLIGELLDLARIESGTLPVILEPTEVNRLVDEAANLFANAHGHNHIAIDVAPDLPLVMADRRRILQVVNNIVSVASRFTDASAPVRITAAHDGGHVQLSVTGPGPSVPAERLSRLFSKRSPLQPDERAAGIDDPALRLAICKGIVDAHGGRLGVDSDSAGPGTRYVFTLPVAQSKTTPTARTRALPAQPEASAIRILVIDDDPLTQRYINGALTKSGYHVIVAADAHQALGLPAANKPDLVLASLAAPSADGVEIMSALRAQSEVPVILLTGYGEDEAMLRAMQAGAADYIVKPFSPTELDARIKAALHEHSAPGPTETAEPFTVGDLTIDYAARTVTVAGEPVPLTRTEYQLLAELSLNAGRVLSHDQLMRRVWQSTSPAAAGIVRSAIKRLRRKLGDDATNPTYIMTAPRMGYRIDAPAAPATPLWV